MSTITDPGLRRHRGRPRPKETIARDVNIIRQLTTGGPQTRNQIASALHLKQSLVYLALNRLRNQGSVRKCAGEGPWTIWAAGQDCP